MKADLARLELLHEALIDSLDRNDPAAIEAASGALDESLAHLRGFDSWIADPELKLAAERIARLAESAAMRVNLLNDHARRRSAALAEIRGADTASVYTR